jgi:GMP synthase-like glutamine amidotransferase
MLIGLLQCDHVSQEHRHITHGDYDEVYRRMLEGGAARRLAAPIVRLRTYAVIDGAIPKSPSECDGWLISSSQFDAISSIDWAARLRRFILATLERAIPIAGICFGHQLISFALGGRVARRSTWVVGVQELRFLDNPWIPARTLKLLGIHRDEVIDPPPGAVVIASTDAVRVAALVVPPCALGIQYHMELTPQYINALLDQRKLLSPENAPNVLMSRLDEPTDRELASELLISFYLSSLDRNSNVSTLQSTPAP